MVTVNRSDAEKERRARLRNHIKETFPDGKIPDPFTFGFLNVESSEDTKHLPFIHATIHISPYEWPNGTPEPEQVFQNV